MGQYNFITIDKKNSTMGDKNSFAKPALSFYRFCNTVTVTSTGNRCYAARMN